MSILKLTLFGPPQLERDGELVHVGRRKALAVLVYLAATGQAHSRDTLATLLWPDGTQRRARGNLRRALSDLKRDTGEELLLLEGETVGLDDELKLWCDVDRFRAFLAACDEYDHHLGVAFRVQGEYDAAEEALQKGLATAISTKKRWWLPRCKAALGCQAA